jgi:hypothetical protein
MKWILFTFSLFIATTRIYVSGTLRRSSDHEPIARSIILVKTSDQIIANAVTDSTGAYSLDFLDIYERKQEFLFLVVQNLDTVLVYRTDHFESDQPMIDLTFPNR